jgi:hypothetical protein
LRKRRAIGDREIRAVGIAVSNVQVLFAIAERHAQSFPMPESAFTVMAMTSGAAAASADDAAARRRHLYRRAPGVGPIDPSNSLRIRISRLGEMEVGVR